MRCFNHNDREAVGTCKVCNKGLCMDCATDLGHGLACKEIHEERAENINNIIEKNSKMYKAAPRNTLIAPFFYLFMGAVFAYFGYTSRRGVTDLVFIMGVGFIVFGIVVFSANKKIFGQNSDRE